VTEISFLLDGAPVSVPADGASLLEALRDRLGVRTVKDGCSPQGQCGCCTVRVDGSARVACVTPVARVAGRAVTTLGGLAGDVRDRWADALVATGGSQCGFCTPGIVVRLASDAGSDDTSVRRALQAHLCRCTGWQTIVEAAGLVRSGAALPERDLVGAARRAEIEGGTAQEVGSAVALGRGGFADDSAPAGALVAVLGPDGDWHVGETLTEARRLAGKVQGRRSSAPVRWPIEVPEGEWARTLQTTWVEPAYLEPDASWCEPGGEPASPLGNGGAFGGKRASTVAKVARELADRHGRAVRVLFAREDVVRLGPKRPPMALGVNADGRGVARVARTPGLAERMREVAPGIEVEEVDVAGPPTSAEVRAAGWAEAAAVLASLGGGPDEVRLPTGAWARAEMGTDGTVRVVVRCGDPLDEVVLRSYCVGAAHMALGWVRSEGLAVDDSGEPLDLTIRSFGVLRAVDTPRIEVRIEADDGPPVNGSDAVFAAAAAAAWRAAGHPPRWPCS
jgi:aerobic-type carbon monoxide dehydrogenase small subunit (CoxS/CutS family)